MPARSTLSVNGIVPVSDRKSTRLNSSHLVISYAVFCLTKKQYIFLKTDCHQHTPALKSKSSLTGLIAVVTHTNSCTIWRSETALALKKLSTYVSALTIA